MVFALTGKTPDDAFTRMEKFRKGEQTLPAKPDGVPERVWEAIEVAMRFNPDQRFADVNEFWEAVLGRGKLPPEPPKVNAIKAIGGSKGAAKTIAIWGMFSGSIRGAIEVTIAGAILGTIWGAVANAIFGTIRLIYLGAIVGSILSVILFALVGAIESITKGKR